MKDLDGTNGFGVESCEMAKFSRRLREHSLRHLIFEGWPVVQGLIVPLLDDLLVETLDSRMRYTVNTRDRWEQTFAAQFGLSVTAFMNLSIASSLSVMGLNLRYR